MTKEVKKNLNELNEEELAELVGGIKSNYETSKGGLMEEIKNLNTTAGCLCNYNNSQNLINENSVASCGCNCTLF
ncbi:MAG: hypothetical protein LBV69_05580 [Bacteroidales bacterium]|jgi:hypothetical protein|nr:hypothetical protein [Bacteroidales bacterium]